jgi:hypothetical protein
MKHHVWTVVTGLILLGAVLGCGDTGKVTAPTKPSTPSKERPAGSAIPPAPPK